MSIVLINETFKKYLINQPAQVRNKIRKQFEFLEIGSWDGSLNVKKIKGTPLNKTIFEARLDRSSRILFTLGKDGNYDSLEADDKVYTADKNILIYVWGMVSHDEISLKSKNIIPKNAPFMNFVPYDQKEFESPFFETFDASFFTQENITKKVSDDSGSQKWHRLAALDWQRIQLYTKDDFELFLYMTPRQMEVLKSVPPVLLSGTAGSGKTTIGVYYLLKTSLARYKKLFITYNKFLKNSAERLYNGLLNSDQSYVEFLQPDFFTYKEFCLQITAGDNRDFNPDKEIDYEKFLSLIHSSGGATINASKYDLPLIWEEIRSIIKGALPQLNVKLFEFALHKIKAKQIDSSLVNTLQRQFNIFENLESAGKIEHLVQRFMKMNIPALIKSLNNISLINLGRFQIVIENIIELFSKQRELTKKKYLSFLEYEMMGKKKAPNFIIDRKIVYRIFEWYQDKLESNKYWDELDLAREAINIINEKSQKNDSPSHSKAGTDAQEFVYDLVVCDEVQDLTDIQHELLFYITKNPLDLILTGDTKQIINPSGFRWEELRQHFYTRNIKVPEVRFLNLNFRSSGSIVELSNCLLDIKTNLLGLSSDELNEDWKFKSRPPVVVTGIKETDMIENLMTTGAKKTILVRTETEKNKLKKHLGTELIFTIYEAKGLEFDTVLLWKFCADDLSKDLWKNILTEEQISYHQAKIKHEINLLYVAITRAQKDLLIYDGTKESVIWKDPQLSEKIFLSDDVDYINNIWNVISTPDEWLEQGDYFFERDYYKAAVECYKNADAKEQLIKAQAFYHEKQGNYLEAAKYFEQLGNISHAVINYEKSSAFSDALRLWTQLKDESKIYEYTLKVYEQEGKFAELALIYLQQKQYQKASDYLLKDKDFENAADIFAFKLKNKEKAAYYYEAAGKQDKAASYYLKLKKYEKAVKLFEDINDYDNAILCWKKLKNEQKLIQLYYRTNNTVELIKIYEKKKDTSSAIKILKRNYSPDELKFQADNLFGSKKYYRAYLRYSAIEDNEGIAETSFLLHNYKDATKYFELIGDFYSAGEAYNKLRDYSKAFLCYTKSEEDKNNNYHKTQLMSRRIPYEEISDYGKHFYEEERFSLALQCANIVFDYVNAGICYFRLNQIDDTLRAWGLCFIYNRLELIAEFCLLESRIDLFSKLILEAPLWKYKSDYNGMELYDESSVVKAMDRYFSQKYRLTREDSSQSLNDQAKEEMAKWAERLILLDHKYQFVEKGIDYFEKSKKYNEYFKCFIELKSDAELYNFYFKAIEFFKNNPQRLEEVNENSAIGLYFAAKDKFQMMIEKLEINENNFLLFLTSSSKEKANEYLLKYYDEETVILFLKVNKEYLKLAQFYELKSELKKAVYYYLQAKEYDKAASLFIESENYLKAGDIYFKIQNYSEALKMYEKHGKNQLKIADTLIKLEKYERAAIIYKQLGRTNLFRKALKFKKSNLSVTQTKESIPQPTLFDDHDN